MGPGYKMAGSPLQREPGQENRHTNAANNTKVAEFDGLIHSREMFRARNKRWVTGYVVGSTERPPFTIEVKGRVAWALDRLNEVGAKGITPHTDPGPRWSAYVHVLRELGVEIETIREAHGEPFSGHHGRYVLRSIVLRVGL